MHAAASSRGALPGKAWVMPTDASLRLTWKKDVSHSVVRLVGDGEAGPGTLYVLDGNGRRWAVDASTGRARALLTGGFPHDIWVKKTHLGGGSTLTFMLNAGDVAQLVASGGSDLRRLARAGKLSGPGHHRPPVHPDSAKPTLV
jgi:hypothetical protein